MGTKYGAGSGTAQPGKTIRQDRTAASRRPAQYNSGIGSAVDATPKWESGVSLDPKLMSKPDHLYAGGDADHNIARQALYGAGIKAGAGLTDYGVGVGNAGVQTLQGAAMNAADDRNAAYGVMATGSGIGSSGIYEQNRAVDQARRIAAQNTASLAQLQLRQAQDQQAQQMMAQAASARGGNQAAAMRNAQAQAAQNALVTNQQAAQLRAQEQQAQVARRLQVEQMAGAVGGNQAGLGYGLVGSGLGAAGNSTGAMGSFGAATGRLGEGFAQTGIAQQGQYLGAQSNFDRTQAELDMERAAASQKRKDKIFDGVMGGVGSFVSGIGGMF